MQVTNTERRSRIVEAFLLGLIVLGAALLRLFRLDSQSLWYDEAFSVYVSSLPFSNMTAPIVELSWNHPPLYYYLLRLWILVFGEGDFYTRLFSVLFGVLSILLIYHLARLLFDRRSGYLAAFLLGISQLGIMYSQEARPYALLLFLVIVTIDLFIIGLRGKNNLAWWGFVGSTILMLYTNYYSVLVLLCLLIFLVIYRKRYTIPLWILCAGAVLGMVAFIPWMRSGVIESALGSLAAQVDQPVWFAVGKGAFLEAVNAFNNGKTGGLLRPSPAWTYWVGAILFTLPAMYALTPLFHHEDAERETEEQENLVLLLLWILPAVLVLSISHVFNIQYDVRYLLFTIVPYYLLVARGITRIDIRALSSLLIGCITIYSLLSLRANFFQPYKENYRDALALLAREYRQEDCVVFLPFNQVPFQWSVYQGESPALRVSDIESIQAGKITCDAVWVVAYRRVHSATKQVNEKLRELDITHTLLNENKFLFVRVYKYTPELL